MHAAAALSSKRLTGRSRRTALVTIPPAPPTSLRCAHFVFSPQIYRLRQRCTQGVYNFQHRGVAFNDRRVVFSEEEVRWVLAKVKEACIDDRQSEAEWTHSRTILNFAELTAESDIRQGEVAAVIDASGANLVEVAYLSDAQGDVARIRDLLHESGAPAAASFMRIKCGEDAASAERAAKHALDAYAGTREQVMKTCPPPAAAGTTGAVARAPFLLFANQRCVSVFVIALKSAELAYVRSLVGNPFLFNFASQLRNGIWSGIDDRVPYSEPSEESDAADEEESDAVDAVDAQPLHGIVGWEQHIAHTSVLARRLPLLVQLCDERVHVRTAYLYRRSAARARLVGAVAAAKRPRAPCKRGRHQSRGAAFTAALDSLAKQRRWRAALLLLLRAPNLVLVEPRRATSAPPQPAWRPPPPTTGSESCAGYPACWRS